MCHIRPSTLRPRLVFRCYYLVHWILRYYLQFSTRCFERLMTVHLELMPQSLLSLQCLLHDICLHRHLILILIHPLDMLPYLVHNPYLDCPIYRFRLLLLSLVADVLHLGYCVAPAHCFLFFLCMQLPLFGRS